MSATIAVVADDLTGAADAAAGFLRASLRVFLTWPTPALDDFFVLESDVLAIDARTRVLDSKAAVTVTSSVVSALFNVGVVTLYKKVDSMLRGHIGPEVRATLDAWHPRTLAVVAPAFPAMGRTTIDGRQRVNGVLVDRPGLSTLLDAAGVVSRSADLATVRGGGLADLFRDCLRDDVRAIVCDAEVDTDLRAIADAGAEYAPRVVWVGSAGLSHALAERVGPRSGPVPRIMVARGESGGILTVVGSANPVATEQAQQLANSGIARIEVPVSMLVDSNRAARVALGEEIVQTLRGGDVVVALPAPEGDTDDPKLAARLGDVLEPCGPLAKAVVLTGGETATHVLRAWGIAGLTLIDEVEPGVPLGLTIGRSSMPIVTKAGSFGDREALTRAVTRLRQMTIDVPRGWRPKDAT